MVAALNSCETRELDTAVMVDTLGQPWKTLSQVDNSGSTPRQRSRRRNR